MESMAQVRQTNWGGNLTYRASQVQRPRTLEEVRDAVRAAQKVKALGTRHAFSSVADTEGDLISLEGLSRVLFIDAENRTVTLEGGVRYGELAPLLHAQGLALPNLASLPHLSVAGACATGTHGSGDRQQGLASAVTKMRWVGADGALREASRERGDLAPVAVHLGALGVVTELTLALEPSFEVRQDVYEGLTLDVLEQEFDAVMGAADSVSLLTTWRGGRFHQAWLKRRIIEGQGFETPQTWFGAERASGDRHPIPGHSAEGCTPQGGVPGPWFERLPHFRLSHNPSHGQEVQSEYFVPREHGPAAMRALSGLGDLLETHLLVSEVRTVRADDLWLSPAYGRDSVALHFTWRCDEPGVRRLLRALEAALEPFHARPHWGKLFETPPERLQSLFPRLVDFLALAREHDPHGKFRNAFLDALG